jgi:hypothetical protein
MYEMEQYLLNALGSFVNDPADSEYQQGYKAALEATLEYLQTLPEDAE